jgi:hypothetical protein
MPWSYDRTGFPLLELPALHLSVHLLPVAKAQFERFLAEPHRELAQGRLYGDLWYEKLLDASPRVTPREARAGDVESLFMAGLLPAEIGPYAEWLGDDFQLPTTEVWRAVDSAVRGVPLVADEVVAIRADAGLNRQARAAVDAIIRLRDPAKWGQLMMLDDGLLEWVRTGPQSFGGLGRPRVEFQKMILNPQRDAPVRPVREGRHKYFGFRLVRPL